jgi:PKHD-type hydroxylase
MFILTSTIIYFKKKDMYYSNPFVDNYQEKNVDYFNYYYFENVFSEEEIDYIIELGEGIGTETATIAGSEREENLEYRNSKVSWITFDDDNQWLFDRLAGCVITANSEMWNFDLTAFGDNIQFTKYEGEVGGHYHWHSDIGESVSHRKLSVIVQLSDEEEYEGGLVQFNIGHRIIDLPKTKGAVFIFPSFILHRVNPVVAGTRRSLVSWITGPNLK